ncbi:glycosyltransferase family 2 protein [Geomonas edaphica]|uniref:glycosyltransferase family 2 protein n=1 Tax=Geomonas edaphica TaxID=2570226 RepID=UPI0013A5DCFA|nr:glycosyltransferase family A protein [Geomonas edaphica]
MVDVDVIVPTFGRDHRINATLQMLLKQSPLPVRVIVVNQTLGILGPATATKLAYEMHKVDLVWLNRSEASLCGARNDALRVSVSPICLFLDDDILVPSDLVGKHWNSYQYDKDLAALGGQVWHRLSLTAIDDLNLKCPELGTTKASMLTVPVQSGPLFGCHFSIRREIALSIGGWDESFIGSANWEEGDLMNRLTLQGMKFIWHPDIWLIHIKEPMGGCRIPGNQSFQEWTKTANFFLYKYRYPKEKSWKLVLLTSLRSGPLRKENILNPLRWPTAWCGLFKGWFLGYRRAHNPILISSNKQK